MAKRIKSGILFVLLVAVFVGMFAAMGPGVYNDSDQYIKMHIHREPLYPLFLAALRAMFGESWLTAMGIIQNVLAAFSVWTFAEYISKRFSLRLWQEILVVLLALMPHMITMCFSALHLFMTNSVMSEALCLPLFTLFVMECFKIWTEKDLKAVRRAVLCSLLLAFLLSLTRSQMMLAILIWMVVLGAKILLQPGTENKPVDRSLKQKIIRLAVVVAAVILVFGVRLLAVKSYNLVFNGHFINNTYGTVNTLTNILYAADREDGENIEDEEAREFFCRMYDLTEERQANYKYAGDSIREKTEHIESWHDTVKFEMIEDVFYQTYDKTVTSDYIIQNLMADETAGKIIKGIFPKCFGRWLGNYLLIMHYGLIRSVAVVHPVINWVTVLIYLSAIWLTWMVWRRDKWNPAVVVMAIAMLGILANVAAVSMTIMCLSRYMIYGFVPFYTGYFLLMIEYYKIYILKQNNECFDRKKMNESEQ